jgi:hypothetical protein
MKYIILLLVVLPLTIDAVTTKECKKTCKQKYTSIVGGRASTSYDKYFFGVDDIDCTCVFPWTVNTNKKSCDTYCDSQSYMHKYCYYTDGICILHVGLMV